MIFLFISVTLFVMALDKAYDPKTYENDIYQLWEESKSFVPKNRGSSKKFSMIIPPPNANGDLHLGHGYELALEDIIARYQRMKGSEVMFLPGADHAGFETQVVYEKHLAKKGKSRFDFTREELYSQIWDFVAKNKGNYESQFRKLGASLDWDRYVYTLDTKVVKQAHNTFKKMLDEGLIYRGERLVNYCTFHGTGFADIEVEYKQEKSNLWYIRYPLTDGSGEVVVATTRPETMYGDVAVAVHKNDKRYKKFIGKTVKLPLTDREIPILADDMVETTFGTGAVKITPAHDPNDFEVAQRHDLPLLTVIDFEGKMNHNSPEEIVGFEVKEARKKTAKKLAQQGYLVKEDPYEHSVGHCYKCGTVIQPLLREQWFIDVVPLTKPAIQALKDKQIQFYPDTKRIQLIKYLEGLRDWNISRQIAWGIPIPAFQNLDNSDDWIFDDRVDQEIIEVAGKSYRRDPDVFDTWFSSSSWPYATLGYPNDKDFKQYYPLSLMLPGADILYPWVSRMIMFGLYTTGEIPFKQVYLHGLIQDEHGAKMSKSKGNVVPPMEKVDEYGSDAFRMGIVADEAPASNRPYDNSKIVGARNFCNKLWNIARYIENKNDSKTEPAVDKNNQTIADEWMLSRLQHSTEKITKNLENYRFADAYDELYHLVWDDFADWYIEASKILYNPHVLKTVFENILKLAHPFAPFVTETIWQSRADDSSVLATSSWPAILNADTKKAKHFDQIKELVIEIRATTTALNEHKTSLLHENDVLIDENSDLITKLAGLKLIENVGQGSGLKLVSSKHEVWLDISDEKVDTYRDRLEDKLSELRSREEQLKKRLSNKSYVSNAPEKLVNQTKTELDEILSSIEKVKKELKTFS